MNAFFGFMFLLFGAGNAWLLLDWWFNGSRPDDMLLALNMFAVIFVQLVLSVYYFAKSNEY